MSVSPNLPKDQAKQIVKLAGGVAKEAMLRFDGYKNEVDAIVQPVIETANKAIAPLTLEYLGGIQGEIKKLTPPEPVQTVRTTHGPSDGDKLEKSKSQRQKVIDAKLPEIESKELATPSNAP